MTLRAARRAPCQDRMTGGRKWRGVNSSRLILVVAGTHNSPSDHPDLGVNFLRKYSGETAPGGGHAHVGRSGLGIEGYGLSSAHTASVDHSFATASKLSLVDGLGA